MRDLAVLFLHLLTTIARLAGPGGGRAVVAESVLVKHQLLILKRSRHRAPNLRPADRMVAGVCALLMRPSRLSRAAIILQPSTLVRFHRALVQRKYRLLFSSTVRKTPGPKGPHPDVIAAVVAMKQRNPTWGCLRIAQQIAVAFGISLDKDVVRRILSAPSRPGPGSAGPSWLTTLGHAKDRLWSHIRHGLDFPDIKDPQIRLPLVEPVQRIMVRAEVARQRLAARSHPVVERLIGTVRRECLDRTLFWTAADLEQKLLEFQQYYNGHRTHAGGRGARQSRARTRAARRRVSGRIGGSRTVGGCITRRGPRDASIRSACTAQRTANSPRTGAEIQRVALQCGPGQC